MKYMAVMSLVAIIQMIIFRSDLSEKALEVQSKEGLGGMEYITSRLSLGSYY